MSLCVWVAWAIASCCFINLLEVFCFLWRPFDWRFPCCLLHLGRLLVFVSVALVAVTALLCVIVCLVLLSCCFSSCFFFSYFSVVLLCFLHPPWCISWFSELFRLPSSAFLYCHFHSFLILKRPNYDCILSSVQTRGTVKQADAQGVSEKFSDIFINLA